jgi:hypothetical protein
MLAPRHPVRGRICGGGAADRAWALAIYVDIA